MKVLPIIERLKKQVESRLIPDAPVPIVLPLEDDAIAVIKNEKLGYAEGQSFAIEYIDSARKPSTRRITVWGIIAGAGGVPSLVATCHERNAKRQFRVDRIQCFIDYDGEVFTDVPAFLSENFGMDIGLASTAPNANNERWKTVLASVRHQAVLLSALSRSDGKTLSEEINIATNYLSHLAEMNGIMLSEAEILSIYRYANRLRPTEHAIESAVNQLRELPHRHLQRLLHTAVALIDADGTRHPSEVAMVNEIAVELIGVSIV